jgi:peptide/nickel transport system substrate-binding protein
VRAVLEGDLPTYDPIWTTANLASYHGAMVYDTLLGVDAAGQPRPQMVKGWTISADKLTYTFQLRDGLRFTDNTEVTTADVLPSIERWSARSGSGQLLAERIRSIAAKNDTTFTITLRERFPLALDILASTSTPALYVMRRREAECDPVQKIDRIVGSGPFILNEGATRLGEHYVYDRNPNYRPRPEPRAAPPAARW